VNVPEQPSDFDGLSAEALERLLAANATGLEPTSELAPTRELASLYAILRTASAPAEAGAQPGESAALAAFSEVVPVRRMRRTPLRWLSESRTRLAVATGAGVLVLSGGVAAAATGSLPGAAPGTAHDVLGVIGVHVPKGDSGSSGSHGNGTSDTSPGRTGAHPSPRPSGSTGKPAHPTHPVLPAHPSTPAHPSRHATPSPTHPVPPTPTPSHRPTPLPTFHPHAH
jgi:hypothetical protein